MVVLFTEERVNKILKIVTELTFEMDIAAQ